ncbi:hypothetical protein MACK_000130 [Theileria orientalis]|uniref:Iron-sulfur assembly protein n=1 Tax=Theileria orientalis TaxID=68886 RepID=A0A976M9B5_THEOR|nr:hypothetical protein MACK_000130 [Theileria orientalis]
MSSNGYPNRYYKPIDSIFCGFDRNFTRVFNFGRTRHLSSSTPSIPKTKVTWDDYEDISELLFEKHKTLNPLSLRFTDLHEMVKEVVKTNYSVDISGECSEGALERIQMNWLELYEQD